MQHNTAQHITIQCDIIQYNTMQNKFNTIRWYACRTIQYDIIQYNKHNTAHENTTQYNTVQCNTIVYTTEYNTILPCCSFVQSYYRTIELSNRVLCNLQRQLPMPRTFSDSIITRECRDQNKVGIIFTRSKQLLPQLPPFTQKNQISRFTFSYFLVNLINYDFSFQFETIKSVKCFRLKGFGVAQLKT